MWRPTEPGYQHLPPVVRTTAILKCNPYPRYLLMQPSLCYTPPSPSIAHGRVRHTGEIELLYLVFESDAT